MEGTIFISRSAFHRVADLCSHPLLPSTASQRVHYGGEAFSSQWSENLNARLCTTAQLRLRR